MNSSSIFTKTEELSKLLDHKLVLMTKIYDLKVKEEADLKNGGNNINAILLLVENEIKEVDEIDVKFLTLFGELKKLIGVKNMSDVSTKEYPSIASLRTKIEIINNKAALTLELENKNTILLKNIIDLAQKEISQIRKGRQGLNAYEKKSTNVDGYFIDRKK